MANVVLFRLNQTPRLLISVNTPEYEGDVEAVIGPDLSLVQNVPPRYWKRGNGQQIAEMTAQEKQTVDQNAKAEADALTDKLQIDAFSLAKALVKLGVVTKNQLVTAIKEG